MSFITDFVNRIRSSDPYTMGVIAVNVVSSILIVFANKWVYKNYQYPFATFLTLVHFIVTFLGLVICAKLGVFEVKPLKIRSIVPLSVSFCGFVVLNNLSLQYNSVGLYQICKTMTTPVIMIIQTFFYDMTFETRIKLSLSPVLLGVIICTATDFELNAIGLIYASAAVLITSMYQIWSGTKQKELGANSMQLLIYQAPLSSIMLIPLVFIFDDVPALIKYEYGLGVIIAILFSAVLAFFVNLSIFLVIGKTSAVTYNVVGHFKTCCIIVGGFVLFNAPVEWKNVSGVIITVSGVVLYTHFKLEDAEKERQKACAAAAALNPALVSPAVVSVESIIADEKRHALHEHESNSAEQRPRSPKE